MKPLNMVVIGVLAVFLITACAPPPEPPMAPPSAGITPEYEGTAPMSDELTSSAKQAAQDVTAKGLGVEPEDVLVLDIQSVEWNDASLGCPQPGMMYAQVITPGYQATVEVSGTIYEVHMDADGQGVICTAQK